MSTPSAPSIVRTLVPVAVGQLVALAASAGLEVPGDVQNALVVLLGFVVTTVYYLAVRWLEQKFPKIGVLLGWAAVPTSYTPARVRKAVEPEVVDGYDPKH